MIKIAMIEDDLELAEVLSLYLKQFNIEVVNFEEPFLALSSLKLQKFDLLILDLTLPGMDGLDVCKRVVDEFNIPIIISSARSDISDKVTALKLGADDYLPKPYDPRELEIRIRTILRRFNKSYEKEPNIKKLQTKNYVAPSNLAEKMIANDFREILNCEEISIHDDFFILGGNSIKAIMLLSKLQKKFKIDISQIFQFKTIYNLAARLEVKNELNLAS